MGKIFWTLAFTNYAFGRLSGFGGLRFATVGWGKTLYHTDLLVVRGYINPLL